MQRLFFLIFLTFILQNCEKKVQPQQNQEITISKNLYYGWKNGNLAVNSSGRESVIPKENLPAKRIVLLNSSLTGYLLALDATDKIAAMASPQFIFDENLREKIAMGKFQNLGSEQQLSAEKIIAARPDLVLTNYIPTQENLYTTLRQQGIVLLFLEEYKEQIPLQKAAYLKLFGEITGKKAEAEKLLTEINSNYQKWSALAKKNANPTPILANEMYGNIWYLPGGESMLANYLKDAGGNYILKNTAGTGAQNWTFEQVLSVGKNATIWVNAGNHPDLQSLLQSNPAYKILPVTVKGKIYSIGKSQRGEGNNFFEEGNVRVDKVLCDYIKIIHPQLVGQDSLYFFRELK